MSHYVCPECMGRSDYAKNCETEGCSLQGKPLKQCNCSDEQHDEVKTQEVPAM